MNGVQIDLIDDLLVESNGVVEHEQCLFPRRLILRVGCQTARELTFGVEQFVHGGQIETSQIGGRLLAVVHGEGCVGGMRRVALVGML